MVDGQVGEQQFDCARFVLSMFGTVFVGACRAKKSFAAALGSHLRAAVPLPKEGRPG